MKNLLSLFDYTGSWSKPFAKAGWNVIYWDLKHEEDGNADKFGTHGDINDACADYFYEHIFQFGCIDGIIAAVPCTAFAYSGAQWFPEKDADGTTAAAVELVWQTIRIINLCAPLFWCVENPVSRIHKLVPDLGKPVMYFNPCDFGDPYTKKTALYGQFNTKLIKNPVFPHEGSKMHTKYGGKSEATKQARSETPPGFAKAFFQANKDYIHPDHINFDDYVLAGDVTIPVQKKLFSFDEYDDYLEEE